MKIIIKIIMKQKNKKIIELLFFENKNIFYFLFLKMKFK